jgi:hypothetical protein
MWELRGRCWTIAKEYEIKRERKRERERERESECQRQKNKEESKKIVQENEARFEKKHTMSSVLKRSNKYKKECKKQIQINRTGSEL